MPAEVAVQEVPQTSTPAPSSPTSGTPASAPATSATATTPTTPNASERPTDAKSLSAFLQKQDKAADVTTPQSPLVTDAAAAAITPLTTATATGVSDPNASKGPIPFDVHHTALANARSHAVAEFKKTLGPVADFKPDQTAWLIDMAARMKDPPAFYRWFGEQLQAHPTYGQQFRAPTQPKPPTPDVQIMNDKNEVVGTLSQFLEPVREQLTGQFRELLQPFQQDREQRIQQERTDAQQKDLNTRADATMARVNKILGLETLPKDEAAALGKKLLDEMSRTPDAVEAALNLFERDVRPGLEQKGQAKALETNRQKAAANTANGSGPASSSTRPTNQKELAKWMAANEGRS